MGVTCPSCTEPVAWAERLFRAFCKAASSALLSSKVIKSFLAASGRSPSKMPEKLMSGTLPALLELELLELPAPPPGSHGHGQRQQPAAVRAHSASEAILV